MVGRLKKRGWDCKNLFSISARLPLMHLSRMAALQNLAIVPLLPAFRALPCGQSASADTSLRDAKQILRPSEKRLSRFQTAL